MTPAPWYRRIGKLGDGSPKSQEEQICNVGDVGVVMLQHDGSDEGNANAQVLAAAGELLIEAEHLIKKLGERELEHLGGLMAAVKKARAPKPYPKVFVFCNTTCRNRGSWHNMVAIAEDGTALAGHLCSSHQWAVHDMGISPDGWKRDIYAKHYPEGFDVVWADFENQAPEFAAALAKAEEVGKEERAAEEAPKAVAP